MGAVGLQMSDLFVSASSARRSVPLVAEVPRVPAPRKATSVEYLYRDESGEVLFRVVRRDLPNGTKEIRQHRRLDGSWARSLGDARRVPYQLPEVIRAAREGTPIWVVEGEKCAEALRGQGLVATTNPAGAGKWLAEFNFHFADADVIVLPDADSPGRKHAADVADQLRPVARSVRLLELPGLPEHGDVVDWLADGRTVRELRDFADGQADVRVLVTDDGRVTVPTELVAEPTWPWPTLPDGALYGPVGELIRALAPTTEADPAALLASTLTAVGVMFGPGPRVMVGSSPQTAKLFSLVVGKTARARKGTSWSDVRRALGQVDDGTWLAEHQVTGLSSGEGLINRLRDDPAQLEVVEIGRDKSLLVVEPEFGSVLRVTSRQGNTLGGVVREAWDTGPLQVLTRAEPLRSTGHHVGIIGHITAEELRAELSETLAANGFANRFLFVAARRPRLLPRPPVPDHTALEVAAAAVRNAERFARTAGVLARSAAAWDLWHEMYEQIEADDLPGMAGVLTHRGAAQVIRIALIYALVDCSATIEPEHLTAAQRLWAYTEATVRHVFGDDLGDPVANRILRAVRIAGEDGLDGTGVHAALDRNVPKDQIARATSLLRQLGLLTVLEVPSGPRGGRPRRLLVATK